MTLLNMSKNGSLTSEQLSIFITLIIFIFAIGKAIGGNVSRDVRLLFRIGFVLIPIFLFIIQDDGPKLLLSTELVTLFLMLLGFYIMFRGVFSTLK